MRSGIHGTFATLLLMIPVLSIPALAIFGIPQFAPVVASPLDEGSIRDRERRVGQSDLPAADGAASDLDDLSSSGNQLPQDWSDSKPVGQTGDSVPIPGKGRSAVAWNSPDSDIPRQPEPTQRADAWGDDPPKENHRKAVSPADIGMPQSVDRSGFDQRFAAIPPDSKKNTRPQSLEPRNDMVASERAIPRPYQRERESAVPPSTPVRPAPNVREPVTWQGAIRRLNELEIRNFRLERGHRENQFVFICSYTPSDSPRVSFRFEAEADEPLKAVEKVLEQIDEWRERR